MKKHTKWFHPDVELLDSEFDNFDCHVIDYIIKTCQYVQPGDDFDSHVGEYNFEES